MEKQRKNKGWKNLKPAKPGECRNPKGRPKGALGFTARLKHAVQANDEKETKNLIRTALTRAKRGDFRFFKEIVDRTDGKVPDIVTGDGTLKVIVEYATSNEGSEGDNPDAARGPAPSDE